MTPVLAGRAAVIAGASEGLGLEIALTYVRAGASVLMCARTGETLERAEREVRAAVQANQHVLAVVADVSNAADVERVTTEAVRQFPQVHALVNNAGVYGPLGPLESVDWNEWTRAVEINLYGSVLMTRALIPHFKQHRYGKIVQLSGGGATNPLPRITAYAASKAAVVRFAESIALELAPFGIDVNSIAPGALNTRMMDQLLDGGAEVVGEEFYRRMHKIAAEGGTPLARGAELAVFLASPQSDGITGRLLSAVWDSWRDLPARREALSRTDVYTLRRIVPGDRGLDWNNK
jgi:NAD(P)-dependent dehydrogenase (short-subunit alcohol dehydrogenase family)